MATRKEAYDLWISSAFEPTSIVGRSQYHWQGWILSYKPTSEGDPRPWTVTYEWQDFGRAVNLASAMARAAAIEQIVADDQFFDEIKAEMLAEMATLREQVAAMKALAESWPATSPVVPKLAIAE